MFETTSPLSAFFSLTLSPRALHLSLMRERYITDANSRLIALQAVRHTHGELVRIDGAVHAIAHFERVYERGIARMEQAPTLRELRYIKTELDLRLSETYEKIVSLVG